MGGHEDTEENNAAGTSDERPRWEGPAQNRPRGYRPAKDDPDVDRDAAGENLQDPERSDLSDAATTRRSSDRSS